MPLKFSSDNLRDFDQAHSHEWLETNGLGGYASSTLSGAHSRRYHGLLVASLRPPVERRVMLSKLDETMIVDGERFELSANQYPGAVHPRGYNFLTHFERGLFPSFTYGTDKFSIRKTIAAIQGENTTVVVYEVLDAIGQLNMELLPLLSARDFHSLSRANDTINRGCVFEHGIFRTKNYHDSPELFISIPGATFNAESNWYYNFEYAVEQYRGLDFQEDLFSHGKFNLTLHKGSTIGIIISTEDPGGKNALTLLDNEVKRRKKLIDSFPNDNLRMLALAADQFIVKRGRDLKTIIAGYHWFSDWGRDTMIALPGLCLTTGRFNDAKKIIQAFAGSVSEGMLPNRFPDHGEAPEYNTVDATLWFFVAIYRYMQYTNDSKFVKSLIPVLEDIVAWHLKGTRYGIRVDDDGLVAAGVDGVQLTWMDAKVGDWVVTPRRGKTVEINALWYNALCILAELKKEGGETRPYTDLASRVKANFSKTFWNESGGYLYDCVYGDHKNDDVRPNQVFALSLPFKLISKERALKVLDTLKEKLVTTKGLRSLSQDHREYKPHYGGGPWQRDGAYHQGTVWSFLLGSYIDALVHLKGSPGTVDAKNILSKFFEHLREHCVGSVSEIFDAEVPHRPRGCIAQAWGVGEILRAAVEHKLFESGKKKNDLLQVS